MKSKENRIELTKTVIDAAECESGKPFVYIMDTVVGGFGVRVTPAGNKQYIIRFQFNGKRISKSFAPVDKLSLDYPTGLICVSPDDKILYSLADKDEVEIVQYVLE